MKCLVTGGAGFIGRWVTKRLIDLGHQVVTLDNYTNGRSENLRDLNGTGLVQVVAGDVKAPAALQAAFALGPYDAVYHLAASIHVQRSIDDPVPTFRNDAEGTLRVLEAAREQYFRDNGLDAAVRQFDFDRDAPKLLNRRPRVTCVSTCMVYDLSDGRPISEMHPYRPASPYAAAKIGSDMLALSYFHAYRMPVTVVRPFNTYGPFQKSNSEGGVVSIFLKRDLSGEPLLVKGSGSQTRDLLYVEDCAEFVVKAGLSQAAEGEVINAGTQTDVAISDLAKMCCSLGNEIVHAPHDHPQAEVLRLLADTGKAARLLGWTAKTSLVQGLQRTRRWLDENRWAW